MDNIETGAPVWYDGLKGSFVARIVDADKKMVFIQSSRVSFRVSPTDLVMINEERFSQGPAYVPLLQEPMLYLSKVMGVGMGRVYECAIETSKTHRVKMQKNAMTLQDIVELLARSVLKASFKSSNGDESILDSLNNDVLRQILMGLSEQDVYNFCSSSVFVAKLCADPVFRTMYKNKNSASFRDAMLNLGFPYSFSISKIDYPSGRRLTIFKYSSQFNSIRIDYRGDHSVDVVNGVTKHNFRTDLWFHDDSTIDSKDKGSIHISHELSETSAPIKISIVGRFRMGPHISKHFVFGKEEFPKEFVDFLVMIGLFKFIKGRSPEDICSDFMSYSKFITDLLRTDTKKTEEHMITDDIVEHAYSFDQKKPWKD